MSREKNTTKSIVGLTLTNGMNVITETDGDDYIGVAAIIQMSRSETEGQFDISMIPMYQFSKNRTGRIHKNNVTASWPPNDGIKNSFDDFVKRLRASSSGIVLANQMPQGVTPIKGRKH